MSNDIKVQLQNWRGYSAYEVAVQNGFRGTQLEWLETLAGGKIQVTVNGKVLGADGDIKLYAGDIPMEEGAFNTVGSFLAKTLTDDRIVNALSSEDATKVLSAAQGKVLAQMMPGVMLQVVTLPVSGWTLDEGTELYGMAAEVAGVTEDKRKTAVVVSPSTDRTMKAAYADAEVCASAQGDGLLVFTATDLPEMDLEVNVMVVVLGVRE